MLIGHNKKISLDKFIYKSLYDKDNGYYIKKNPFGKKSDFITSPNISVLFSEMISIWLISFWENLKKPKKINIVELGAGNGEMMSQIIKTLNNFSEISLSANFLILEKSPLLIKIQRSKIDKKKVRWIKNLKEIPSIIIDADDLKSLEFAIVENVQRHDLNPIEEANGYKKLMDDFGYDQDKVAKFIGKSRAHIANCLRLLSLPDNVIQLVETNKLSQGYAKILVGLENCFVIAKKIIDLLD